MGAETLKPLLLSTEVVTGLTDRLNACGQLMTAKPKKSKATKSSYRQPIVAASTLIGNKWVTSQQLLTTIPALYEVLKVPWKVHDPREGGIKHMITDLTQSVMDGEIQNGMPHLRKCPGSMKEARVTLMAEIVSHDTAPGNTL